MDFIATKGYSKEELNIYLQLKKTQTKNQNCCTVAFIHIAHLIVHTKKMGYIQYIKAVI